MSFAQKFKTLSKKRSSFCLGIDPSLELLKSWGLPCSPDGLQNFCDIILAASKDHLAIVKPQAAYFEAFGPEGWSILQNLIKSFHERDTLVLLDVKRGDIGSTSLAYAKAYLGPSSPYQCDAITAVAYLGFDALMPMFQHAQDMGAAVFLVLRSSNPEGALVQNALVNASLCLSDQFAQDIKDFNRRTTDPVIGAVMGATLAGPALHKTLGLLGNSFLLCPGIGYQGAQLSSFFQEYKTAQGLLIPTASRSILGQGPEPLKLETAIKLACAETSLLLR
jgi:orotidine-5'-phosphate decarboxylase